VVINAGDTQFVITFSANDSGYMGTVITTAVQVGIVIVHHIPTPEVINETIAVIVNSIPFSIIHDAVAV